MPKGELFFVKKDFINLLNEENIRFEVVGISRDLLGNYIRKIIVHPDDAAKLYGLNIRFGCFANLQ